MPRPRKIRIIKFIPSVYYYKPQGIPLRLLDEVSLSYEEMETLRLKYIKELDQESAAKKMNISQPTFCRTLDSALEKSSIALLKGLAIRISNEKQNK